MLCCWGGGKPSRVYDSPPERTPPKRLSGTIAQRALRAGSSYVSDLLETDSYSINHAQQQAVDKELRETLKQLETTPPALHFQALRHEFCNDADLAEAVRRWEAGESDQMWVDEAQTTPALGALPATLPPHMRGKPIFQCFVEQIEGGASLQDVLPTVVYEDRHCLVFSPAGFRGDVAADEQLLKGCESAGLQAVADRLTKTPLTMNPTSLNHGQGAALMSHAHVLIIPRRRIYNAVTLKESDVSLVRHMATVGRAAVRALLQADGRTVQKTVEPLQAVPTTLEELTASQYLPGGLGMSADCSTRLAQDICTTFHVYPQQSIGWLHMHAFCGAMLTRNFDSMNDHARQKCIGELTGVPKNIPASIIIAMLEGTPAHVPLPPVDYHQVQRAINAASIIQHVWRHFSVHKQQCGRGLSKRALRESLRGRPNLRDMPRASIARIRMDDPAPAFVYDQQDPLANAADATAE